MKAEEAGVIRGKMQGKANPTAYDLFELGLWMARLSQSTAKDTPWSLARIGLEVLAGFKYYKGLESIANDAEKYLQNAKGQYGSDNDCIKAWDASILREKVEYWRGWLKEASESWVVFRPISSLDITKLKSGVTSFLTLEEWQTLTTLEQDALSEAFACLLSNAFTSAEFMSLRLTESLLRRWYASRTGKNPARLDWFGILDKLNDEFPQDKRPKELSLLDYLRQRRNEIAHPDVISSSDDAATTFLNGLTLFRGIKTNLPQT
jgi:hypothetical protein